MSSVNKFNCIFCSESFESKEVLQVHFRKHGDPSQHEQITKNNRKRPASTQQSSEAETDESGGSQGVSCDVCDDIFPTIARAIAHRHKIHPDHHVKYFCPWCGKLFPIKHLLDKHIVTHQSETPAEEILHCDMCEFDFLTTAAMLYHNKFFHRQHVLEAQERLGTPLNCKKMRVVNDELIQILYCPECGLENINHVNLHKHITDVHGDILPGPSIVFRCPLCDALFHHTTAYETHLELHSADDNYGGDEENPSEGYTEFTLETVEPILENIEKVTQVDMDLNKILEIGLNLPMAGDDNGANDNEEPSYSQEIHKKSKKEKKKNKAITLDQFLNMNKDLFGECIGIEGVEEVPSRVIANQLRRKPKAKPVPVAKAGLKVISKDNLQKLRQQGVVVQVKNSNKMALPIGSKVRTLNTLQGGKQIRANNTVRQPGPKMQSNLLRPMTPGPRPISNSVGRPLQGMSNLRQVNVGSKITQVPLKVAQQLQAGPVKVAQSQAFAATKIGQTQVKSVKVATNQHEPTNIATSESDKADIDDKNDFEQEDDVDTDECTEVSNTEIVPPKETSNQSLLKQIGQTQVRPMKTAVSQSESKTTQGPMKIGQSQLTPVKVAAKPNTPAKIGQSMITPLKAGQIVPSKVQNSPKVGQSQITPVKVSVSQSGPIRVGQNNLPTKLQNQGIKVSSNVMNVKSSSNPSSFGQLLSNQGTSLKVANQGPVKVSSNQGPVKVSSNQGLPFKVASNQNAFKAGLNQAKAGPKQFVQNRANANRTVVKPGPKVGNKIASKPAEPESKGYFSCFKKPKESLIPISDVTSVADVLKTMETTLATSNQACTTTQALKPTKPNAEVVNSSKSQESTQNDSLGKHKNNSHLEALEKLKKQGLLIKKPKLDKDDSSDQCLTVKSGG